jgi:hypothetical protein
MYMFTHGLDVVNPNTVIKNLHFSNYGSASKNARGLCDYLNLKVKNSHLLRTKVGSGLLPPKVVPLAFILKPGQPGKFHLISDASAPGGLSTNSLSPTLTKFHMAIIPDVMACSDEDTWGTITDTEAAFCNLPNNPFHTGLSLEDQRGRGCWGDYKRQLQCP